MLDAKCMPFKYCYNGGISCVYEQHRFWNPSYLKQALSVPYVVFRVVYTSSHTTTTARRGNKRLNSAEQAPIHLINGEGGDGGSQTKWEEQDFVATASGP
jgi:hypothetical protein